jgi:hypothetical protein
MTLKNQLFNDLNPATIDDCIQQVTRIEATIDKQYNGAKDILKSKQRFDKELDHLFQEGIVTKEALKAAFLKSHGL